MGTTTSTTELNEILVSENKESLLTIIILFI